MSRLVLPLALTLAAALAACITEEPVGPRLLCNQNADRFSLALDRVDDTVLFRVPVRATDTIRIRAVPYIGATARADVPVRFTVQDTTIVQVSDSGVVQARAEGATTVRVQSCYVDTLVRVTSLTRVASLALSPARDTMAVGDSLVVRVTALDRAGQHVADPLLAVTAIPAGVVSAGLVDDTTLVVRALVAGDAALRVAGEGQEASAALTVAPPAARRESSGGA